MTTYSTQNQLGSSDPRDLYDNAENLDNFVNGAQPAYNDRLGESRKSWQGMEDEFAAFIAASGYEFVGDYAAGIEITGYQQVVRDINGEFWRVAAGTELPYTTTGAGLPEGGAFVAVGDAVLRQELDSNTAGQGSDLIAHTGTSDTVTEALNNRVIRVSSRTEMKAYDVPAGYQFSLEEGGRSGLFVVKAGIPPSDPQEACFVLLTNGNYAERIIKNGEISIQAFGAIEGVSSGAESGNTAALNAAHQWSSDNGLWIVYDNTEALEVDSTVYIYEGTRIINRGDGGILRLNKTADGDGRIDVLSLGVAATFVKNWKIKGGLPVQFSAGITDVNKRGEGTAVINLNNTYDFELEVKVQYAESALYGKSVFNGKGDVRILWCYRGWDLDPSRTNPAGAACTSLNFYNTFDFTIFPFVLTTVLYSNFNGYIQAVRQAYAHYETDEIAVCYTLDGCGSTNFDFGIEAFQGAVYRSEGAPNFVSMRNRLELGSAAEDHLVRDATRTSNIPYAEQAYYSLANVCTLLMNDSVFSGSTVTTSTDDAAVFYKAQASAKVDIRGGFWEPGSFYTPASGAGILTGFTGSATRFLKTIIYADGGETIFPLGNGLVLAQISGLSTDASGEVVISTPAGYGRILTANVYLNRPVGAADNAFAIKSKASNSWTFVCGLGAGYGVYAEIICIENT